MRAEYDFSAGVRGVHHEAYRAGTNVVFLEADLVEAFPDSASVNQALRLLVKLSRSEALTGRRPNTYQPSPRQGRRSSPSGHRIKKTRDRKR
jgi:hypothetical protein